MTVTPLSGDGISLTELRDADISRIAEYCADPAFERFMSTPWPYTTADATWFVHEYAPAAWRDGTELVWAIRRDPDGPLLGTIGLKLPRGEIGFWLGAPHRGGGIMSAAVAVVVEAALPPEGGTGPLGPRVDHLAALHWEAVVGNTASLRVARRAGFAYAGTGPGSVPARTGEVTECWHGVLTRAAASAAAADAAAGSAGHQPPWPA